jgi:2-keto-4-pentenoate hydratase/2-oxohepta-3-ene-1,7-dioic acid hydratase in catechol pathway
MKLATYRLGSNTDIGIVDSVGARVFDLAGAAARAGKPGPFGSMLELIDADDVGLEAARALLAARGGEADLWRPLSEIALLAPLPQPRQMRDGMSYATHIRQSGRGAAALLAKRTGGEAAYRAGLAEPLGELASIFRETPIYYITNRNTVVGPDTTVVWPAYSQVMDYELETAVVTKRTKANIKGKDAGAHIFGYTIFNDLSARDRQMHEMQGRLGPAKGKSFDGSNVLGPWIVTPDEIGDIQGLKAIVRVNGEIRADTTTSDMLFPFEAIIADAAQDETIFAGEVFGSGTVGNCCGLEIGRFLESGDVIELEVEKIGVLRTKVVRRDA